jgi:hypothetical protein
MTERTRGKLIALILAIVCLGAYVIFRNPLTDIYTYPPQLKIQQKNQPVP